MLKYYCYYFVIVVLSIQLIHELDNKQLEFY